MLKNNNGVSLITLVITIVVMVIMISIVLNSSITSVNETNETKIENEIKSLKNAVNDRVANHERNATLYPLVGEKLGNKVGDYLLTIEKLETKKINQIREKDPSILEEYYRLVGKAEAEKLGVEGIDIEHYYVVDYYECEVYGPISLDIVDNGG